MTPRAIGGLRWAIGAVCLVLLGCSVGRSPWEETPGSPRVVVTIAPLYSFVKAVGGDRVAVRCLCTTTGPHHYEADASDVRMVASANVLFAVGLGLDETFADKLYKQCGNPKLRYLELGEEVDQKLLRKLTTPIAHGDHVHDGADPHIWLGLDVVGPMVDLIARELSQVDPEHAGEYRDNAEKYRKRLDALKKEGEKLQEDGKQPRIITNHDSMHYFARTFKIDIADILERNAGEAPAPQEMAKLVDRVVDSFKSGKGPPIRVIAIEPQFPQHATATSLKDEVKAKSGQEMKLVELDPLETADTEALKSEGAEWYENRIRANLKALSAGLR
jgi:zinc transport system substrate-binding protein